MSDSKGQKPKDAVQVVDVMPLSDRPRSPALLRLHEATRRLRQAGGPVPTLHAYDLTRPFGNEKPVDAKAVEAPPESPLLTVHALRLR